MLYKKTGGNINGKGKIFNATWFDGTEKSKAKALVFFGENHISFPSIPKYLIQVVDEKRITEYQKSSFEREFEWIASTVKNTTVPLDTCLRPHPTALFGNG